MRFLLIFQYEMRYYGNDGTALDEHTCLYLLHNIYKMFRSGATWLGWGVVLGERPKVV